MKKIKKKIKNTHDSEKSSKIQVDFDSILNIQDPEVKNKQFNKWWDNKYKPTHNTKVTLNNKVTPNNKVKLNKKVKTNKNITLRKMVKANVAFTQQKEKKATKKVKTNKKSTKKQMPTYKDYAEKMDKDLNTKMAKWQQVLQENFRRQMKKKGDSLTSISKQIKQLTKLVDIQAKQNKLATTPESLHQTAKAENVNVVNKIATKVKPIVKKSNPTKKRSVEEQAQISKKNRLTRELNKRKQVLLQDFIQKNILNPFDITTIEAQPEYLGFNAVKHIGLYKYTPIFKLWGQIIKERPLISRYTKATVFMYKEHLDKALQEITVFVSHVESKRKALAAHTPTELGLNLDSATIVAPFPHVTGEEPLKY